MHPSRFSFLAYNNKQTRKIVSKTFTSEGWNLLLECEHYGGCVAHMVPGVDWKCYPCGEEYIRSAPQYAKEFKVE
jgi:hypothetical protein